MYDENQSCVPTYAGLDVQLFRAGSCQPPDERLIGTEIWFRFDGPATVAEHGHLHLVVEMLT